MPNINAPGGHPFVYERNQKKEIDGRIDSERYSKNELKTMEMKVNMPIEMKDKNRQRKIE
jgi:hypothetical protein